MKFHEATKNLDCPAEQDIDFILNSSSGKRGPKPKIEPVDQLLSRYIGYKNAYLDKLRKKIFFKRPCYLFLCEIHKLNFYLEKQTI